MRNLLTKDRREKLSPLPEASNVNCSVYLRMERYVTVHIFLKSVKKCIVLGSSSPVRVYCTVTARPFGYNSQIYFSDCIKSYV